jgi:hypothetical protein
MKDLIILVADQNMRDCIDGLIPRIPIVYNISSFTYDIFVHTNRDPGCRAQSSDFLKSFQNKYRFALVIFDKEGCGKETLSKEDIERNVEQMLTGNGWNDRAKAIVIDPELENWIWIKSPRLAQIISWQSIESLYQWLIDRNYISEGEQKPREPKEAFERALYISQKRRSSSIYKQIASQASFRSCTDLSFLKLVELIINWFPARQ